jgi:hypothetical protein
MNLDTDETNLQFYKHQNDDLIKELLDLKSKHQLKLIELTNER